MIIENLKKNIIKYISTAVVIYLISTKPAISLNYENPDPKCPVNVVHHEPRKVESRGAVLLNQGRDGQAAALVLMAE